MMKYLFWGLPTWAALFGIGMVIRQAIWGGGTEDSDESESGWRPDEPKRSGRFSRESHSMAADFAQRASTQAEMDDWGSLDPATGVPVEDLVASGRADGFGVEGSDN